MIDHGSLPTWHRVLKSGVNLLQPQRLGPHGHINQQHGRERDRKRGSEIYGRKREEIKNCGPMGG